MTIRRYTIIGLYYSACIIILPGTKITRYRAFSPDHGDINISTSPSGPRLRGSLGLERFTLSTVHSPLVTLVHYRQSQVAIRKSRKVHLLLVHVRNRIAPLYSAVCLLGGARSRSAVVSSCRPPSLAFPCQRQHVVRALHCVSCGARATVASRLCRVSRSIRKDCRRRSSNNASRRTASGDEVAPRWPRTTEIRNGDGLRKTGSPRVKTLPRRGRSKEKIEQTPREFIITEVAVAQSSDMRGSKRDWIFRVQVPNLEKNEVVYMVGNLPELGAWNHNQAILMSQEHSSRRESPIMLDNNSIGDFYSEDGDNAADGIFEEDGRIFSQKVALPIDANIEFRYFIAVICQSNGTKNSAKTLIIRRWETHMTPRVIKKSAPSNFDNDTLPDPDKFGYHNHYSKIERGWLTDETVIQFKLFNNPIKLWKNRLQNKKVHIKMTPVNLVRHNSLELQQFGGDCIDDSLSMDTQDIVDQPAFTSITEIAVMNDEEARFKFQEQFGRPYNEDEFVIFNVAVRYPETIGYLVDYYVYSSRCFPGEPPNHIGFSYILPGALQPSVGLLTVPITSTKHRPIGQLTVEYVVIKPIPDHPWDMSISYAKHWEQRWSGLDVGHRGLGTSFKFETKNCANVRENTVASLKTASHHGADMVEFDVQLSKDFIPVIYHDFYVSISMKRKKQIEAMDMLEIPVKDLTLEQLHLLKDYCYPRDSLGKVLYYVDKAEQGVNRLVYHVAEGRQKNPRFFDEDLEDHQPFPTLQTVLQELEQHVGCNIEIKWTMQLKDGTFELNHPFDLNIYLDIILKVVLEYGGNRKIVFSSFNPDICAMIRLKQNKYPMVFLTQGITSKYPTYHDPRCQTIPMAMRHALAADILGINVHTEDILRDPSQVKLVKDAGLIIFCWGDDNNDKDTIQYLKKLGLHAVIYDKIDEYNAKEVKESIFLVDARESQKELIALAHSNQTPQTQISTPLNTEKDYYLNRPSTTTSFLKNNIDGDSIYSVPNMKLPTNCEESIEINEMTKDFSACANTFGHSVVKTNGVSGMTCGQPTPLPEFYGEDEAAKDCL